MKLGVLIQKLEQCDPDRPVRFEFGGCVPTTFDSWRGIYAELALGFGVERDAAPNVRHLLKSARDAVGSDYEGYKGGTYRMDEQTEVHIDNYGRCTYTALVGVVDDGHCVYLETRRVES